MYRLLLVMTVIGMMVTVGCSAGSRKGRSGPIIIGHRGASYKAPENTVASTVLAFKEHADASEFDVHLSKDNRIMVIHDKTTKRTAGTDLKVAETDSHVLRELEVGRFKSEAYAGEKIPFISEVFNVLPEGKTLFIEVKCGPEIAPYLRDEIEASGKADRMTIISFDFEALVACKRLLPSIPAYYLKSVKKDKETGQYPPYDTKLIDQAVEAGLEGLDLFYGGLTKEFVDKAHQAGLEVYVWTVNDVEDARRMCAYGVDGITTDMPGMMRSELFGKAPCR